MTRTIPGIADKADAALFDAAEAMDRLAESTGDPSVAKAAKAVGAARRFARAHMTAEQRGETPY
jgi:hypothetical protein